MILSFLKNEVLACLEVKGEATEASESDKDIPAWAAFKAPQSLAPSPHIPKETRKNSFLVHKSATRCHTLNITIDYFKGMLLREGTPG